MSRQKTNPVRELPADEIDLVNGGTKGKGSSWLVVLAQAMGELENKQAAAMR
jgi:hypothetical protein